MAYKDISGQRFGRLVAVKMVAEKHQRTKWLCRCDCGVEKLIPLNSLTSGKGTSCGCYRKEVTGNKFRTHGRKNKRLYNIWLNMRQRCSNPNVESFKNYGERGIAVCSEWDDYESFYRWSLNNGYRDDLTIDRIDNSRGYTPSNCRWVDYEVQMNNTTKNVRVEIDGVERTLSEHAKDYGINYYTLYHRYETGLRGKKLVEPLKKQLIMIDIDGVSKPLKTWSKEFNLSYATVQYRYNKGLRGKELF